VAETLKQHNCDFGGETSGSWIFPKITYCPDGIYAAAHLVEIITEQGPLDQLLSAIPSYQTLRASLRCQNPKQTMSEVSKDLKEGRTELDIQEINTLDGIKITTPNGWALIRPSGTEPKIRITVETRNTPPQELYQQAEKLVKKHIKT
jgi:phosphoglucosamine mutase